MKVEVVKSVQKMQETSEKLRQTGFKVKLVPTMGALHDGHAALVKAAMDNDADHTRGDSDDKVKNIVIVSIFLNRKQFNNQADFDSYPNTLEADIRLCEKLGAHYIFMPSNDEMYPPGQSPDDFSIEPPKRIAHDLEGLARPGHFCGMLTCVCKLLNIIRPVEAYFGEKDYQQLVLVSRMVRDLNMGGKIIPVKTVREIDLLPMSSRNVHLDKNSRKKASLLYKILVDAKSALENLHESQYVKSIKNDSIDLDIFLLATANSTLCLQPDLDLASEFEISYLALRCAADFSHIAYDSNLGLFYRMLGLGQNHPHIDKLECRLLIAVTIGGVRLLDNMRVILNNRDTR